MKPPRLSLCPGCGRGVAVAVAEPSLLGCPGCATVFELPGRGARGPSVIVAHPDETVLAASRVLLDRAGCEPIFAADGRSARAAVIAYRPSVLVLDPELPEAPAQGWIPELRADARLAGLQIVLVGSGPGRLPGADAWIDSHRLEQDLVPRIQTLLTAAAHAARRKQ